MYFSYLVFLCCVVLIGFRYIIKDNSLYLKFKKFSSFFLSPCN